MSHTSSKPNRVQAVDLVRLFVVAAVIITHIGATGPLYDSQTSSLVWMFSHVSRNIFFLLMAFVLCLGYGPHRELNVRSFYRKRFPLVLIPYLVWSIIYILYYGVPHNIVDVIAHIGSKLVLGEAAYHVYFLLVTMQLYLIFPLVRTLAAQIMRYPKRIFVASFILQLTITALIYFDQSVPGLNWWLKDPDIYVMSYQLYIVAGITLALYYEPIKSWLLRYATGVAITTLSTLVVAYVVRAFNLLNPVTAYQPSAVFQPYMAVESLVFTAALLTLGLIWVRRGARFAQMVSKVSENTFGIYLSHVLILGLIAGLIQPEQTSWYSAVPQFLIGIPLVYVISYTLTELLRHTWLSLPLTGRRRSQTPLLNAPIRRSR